MCDVIIQDGGGGKVCDISHETNSLANRVIKRATILMVKS